MHTKAKCDSDSDSCEEIKIGQTRDRLKLGYVARQRARLAFVLVMSVVPYVDGGALRV